MKRTFKWLTLVLILAEVALVRFKIIDLRTAIGIIVAVELLLFLAVSRQVFVAVSTYRRDRLAGFDAWAAMEDGAEVFLPRAGARVMVAEWRLWFCLGTWLFRRIHRGETDFTYHGKSNMWAFSVILLFTTPAEVFLVEMFLPWSWLRWLVILASLYAFFWIAGLYASMVALPHRLGESTAVFSNGIMATARVPYINIGNAMLRHTSEGLRGDGLRVFQERAAAHLAVGGSTDVVLTLRKPMELEGWLRQTSAVREIHVAADEPERLVREIAKRLASAGPAS